MKKGTKMAVATTLVAGGGLIAAAAPAKKPPAKPTAKKFEFKAHGVSVLKNAPGTSNRRQTNKGGQVRMEESTSITIRGLGSHKVKAVVVDEPIAKGGKQTTTVTDISKGTTTEFSYVPGTNSITISDGKSRVSIVQNPNHTYSVDGKPAKDGKAVVALLRNKPAYRGANPHGVMLAYAYAHAPNAAAKNTQNCDLPSCCETGVSATPPAVCSVFRDVCECVACDKTGHAKDCKTCK
ncbi:MAG: hypothetical protein KC502_05420 [Myxococcales bacterium]|nr:hypothetical protein [Myxococcales bacterium]